MFVGLLLFGAYVVSFFELEWASAAASLQLGAFLAFLFNVFLFCILKAGGLLQILSQLSTRMWPRFSK
jgi:hypothetical protein